MNIEDCKEGVRVSWGGNDTDCPDTGVIVRNDGSIFNEYFPNDVWVKWDSDGEILNIHYTKIKLQPEIQTEEQAVMLLLSKGYTLSKPKE